MSAAILNTRGVWNKTTLYEPHDVVLHGDQREYVCVKKHKDLVPDRIKEFWLTREEYEAITPETELPGLLSPVDRDKRACEITREAKGVNPFKGKETQYYLALDIETGGRIKQRDRKKILAIGMTLVATDPEEIGKSDVLYKRTFPMFVENMNIDPPSDEQLAAVEQDDHETWNMLPDEFLEVFDVDTWVQFWCNHRDKLALWQSEASKYFTSYKESFECWFDVFKRFSFRFEEKLVIISDNEHYDIGFLNSWIQDLQLGKGLDYSWSLQRLKWVQTYGANIVNVDTIKRHFMQAVDRASTIAPWVDDAKLVKITESEHFPDKDSMHTHDPAGDAEYIARAWASLQPDLLEIVQAGLNYY